MLKSFVFTHCAVESHSNNLYLKRWFILFRLVMWQIENAVTDVLALAIDSGFICNGGPCTCPLIGGITRGNISAIRSSTEDGYDSRRTWQRTSSAESSNQADSCLLMEFALPVLP